MKHGQSYGVNMVNLGVSTPQNMFGHFSSLYMKKFIKSQCRTAVQINRIHFFIFFLFIYYLFVNLVIHLFIYLFIYLFI